MRADNVKKALLTAFVTAAAAALILSGRAAAAGAAAAVELCLTVMIPSLYAFTVISKLLITTDIYKLLSKPFAGLSRYVFRMPPCFFPVFIISQLAGYPIGAALIGKMYDENRLSRSSARDMLCFCIAPGPAYIMAVAESAAPGNDGLWLSLFISVAGANTAAALLTAPFRSIPENKSEKAEITVTPQSFTEAVASAAESMLMICAMIVFMSSLLGAAAKYGILSGITLAAADAFNIPPVRVYPFVRSFFEISNLTAISGDATAVLPAAAAMLCFGGLCVHMQIKAVCGELPLLPALAARIPISAAAYFICRELIPQFYTVDVLSAAAEVYADDEIRFGENPPILSMILLIMTILIISQKNIVKHEKI